MASGRRPDAASRMLYHSSCNGHHPQPLRSRARAPDQWTLFAIGASRRAQASFKSDPHAQRRVHMPQQPEQQPEEQLQRQPQQQCEMCANGLLAAAVGPAADRRPANSFCPLCMSIFYYELLLICSILTMY